ncbi:leucine-rich repeat protein, partial [Hallella colorans]|uniref:leucine-rich repeat protein n=1 Tax=Hallella colorans TaxID=1703337 RepID=UPI0023F54D43
MSKNYNNKTKHRSAWFALVLLMITALPITAQTAVTRFQVGDLWYEVVDATNHTVKLTYGNENLDKAKATQQVLADATADLPNEWKGYNGTLKINAVDKNGKKVETIADERAYESATGQIYTITIPDKVNYNGKDWTVTAIGSYAFINERRITKVVLPEKIEAIEDAAFYQSGVMILNFPTNLKYIGWCAFYKSNLTPFYLKEYTGRNPKKKGTWERKTGTAIDIPGSTAIGPQAFEGSFSTSKFKCPNI